MGPEFLKIKRGQDGLIGLTDIRTAKPIVHSKDFHEDEIHSAVGDL